MTDGTNTESYTFDDVGNRTASHLSASYGYQANQYNRLASTATANYGYDANGNMTSRIEGVNTWLFDWDYENRMSSATKGADSVQYKYDALGRRVQRINTSAGENTKFIYDGNDVLVDDNSGTLTKYLNGDGVDNKLRITDANGVKYFLADHLGSTNALADSSGNITSSASYDSFGNAIGNLNTRYQFTGREFDNFTGLNYYRARWYDSQLGRFISEDPIGFAGGDVNLYGYVGNNSLNFRDPSGKLPVVIPIVVGVTVLILSSPSYVNAPAPGDPIYNADNPLFLNAAGGAVCGALWTKFGSPLLRRILAGTGDDIIELGVGGARGGSSPPPPPPPPPSRIPWGSWDDYPKVTVNGNEYAQVGPRLYSRHAVDRMQPSGNRYHTGGQDGGMPQIRQVGGSYDYGRGVPPEFVEYVITNTRGVPQLNGNISHMSGSLEVIVNPNGAVVTIITH